MAFRTVQDVAPRSNEGDELPPLGDLVGDLIVAELIDIERGVETKYGEKDAARIKLLIVDGEFKGSYSDDYLAFNTPVVNKLKRANPGDQVAARIGSVPTKKGNPAIVLEEITDEDATLAERAWRRAGRSKPAASSTRGEIEELGDDEEDF